MADEQIMFRVWVRNEATKESTQILGQGNSVLDAVKDAWEGANDDFGKSSSGAPPISRAKIAVRLPDGRNVLRRPAAFASRVPYDEKEAREFEAPTCSGDAAKPFATLVEEGRAEYAKPRPK